MSIYAVISEFNPFHNGHKYLADKIKNKDSEAAIVAVMSGSFTERGEVAVTDKYARAEMAVKCGVELVIELPAPWCFSGAEFFALGGVSVADSFGVVDKLVFGSESGDVERLSECERRISSAEFESALKDFRLIHPEPSAGAVRAQTYAKMYGESGIFDGSNNLLALEYLRALRKLRSGITPCTVKRVGENFGSTELRGICSASAIREAISRGKTDFSDFMPAEAYGVFKRELDAERIYNMSKLDTAVIAMFLASAPERFSEYMEVDGGLENRLAEAALSCTGIDQLTEAVSSKRYSLSRVRRAILSCMLSVRMSDAERKPLFTSVLAANSRGREVLALARRKSDIAVLSKMSDAKELTGEALEQYKLHMRAERLAELCCGGEVRRVGAVMI